MKTFRYNGEVKEITDLTAQQIYDLAWNEMDEEQQKLITSVENIKKECLALVADQFEQHYHDVGDGLYDLVERCEGVGGGREIAELTIELCEGYVRKEEIITIHHQHRCEAKRMRNHK